MNASDILIDAAARPLEHARLVLDGLTTEEAEVMPGGTANSIAWLLWHAGREIDVQLADLAGGPTVWESGGWAEILGIDREPTDFGLGDTAADVAALRAPNVAGLGEYLEACTEALTSYIAALGDDAFAEIVDRSYDPPVTRATRLVSIIDDTAAHVGQAAYARGLASSWRFPV